MAFPHLFAQSLQRAELKLLYRAFGFTQTLGDFFNAALFDKAFAYNAALNFGKFLDEAEEESMAFDRLHFLWRAVCLGRRVERVVIAALLAIGAFVLIGDGIGSDAEEPGNEGSTTPFVGGKIR